MLLAGTQALAGIAAVHAAPAPHDTQVVRAWFDDEAALDRITPLLDHAQVDRAKGVLRLEADLYLRTRLIAAGFRVDVDAEATLANRRLTSALAQTKSIGGFACYRTVEEAQARIVELSTSHPMLVDYQDIGSSWQQSQGSGGYPLRVIKLTNSAIPGPKPIMFLIGSIHAREYTPAELVLRFAEELVAGYGSDADATWILDHHEIQILVHGNPDGRKQAETGLLWRKNVNNTFCPNTNTRGVDLNRNFPFVWGQYNGSSPTACNETYRGPSAASEPETQAIVDHVRAIYADRRGPALTDAAPADTTGIFIDIHSYSQLVLWPWGFIETRAPNAAALEQLGRRLAGFNNYTAQAAVGLYPTDGTTDDFAYGELGVASYAMELGTEFFQTCDAFQNQVLPQNRELLRYAARALRAPYQLPSGPDARGARIEPDLILAGDPARLTVTFDDARQQTADASNGGPIPAVQPIASARAYLDTPPWQAGANAVPMTPADGAFDATVEQAQIDLATAALAPGRHLVYAQGRDSAGADGPVSAAFVEVLSPNDATVMAGTVKAAGTGTPLIANVQVGNWSSTTRADGGYERLVRSGTYPIVVSAAGYESETFGAQEFAAGQSMVRDFTLYRTCALVEDAVELNLATPFIAQTPWTRRRGAGDDGDDAWLQSASGNHADNLNASLTSGAVNLQGYATTTLAFDQRCDTEAGWDYGIVEVSANGGGTWSEVFRCNGETTWRRVSLPLPQLDGKADARVRFRFTSDNNTNRSGWAVDDIVLSAGGTACRAQQTPPVRIDRFDASATSIVAGATTTLGWDTANADACRIDNDTGAAAIVLAADELATGSRAVGPTADVTYALRCTGVAGPVTRTVSIDVQPAPTVTIDAFAAAPASIVAGASSTLSWTTQRATGCTLADDLGGAVVTLDPAELANGTRAVSPQQDVTYTLSCTGDGGPVVRTVDVDVRPAPPALITRFGATPARIAAGATTTLGWTTLDAVACTIANDADASTFALTAAELASGTRAVTPARAIRYTLTCNGAGGEPVSSQTSVTIAPAPTIDAFTATPSAIVAGEAATLRWTTRHAQACGLVFGGATTALTADRIASGSHIVTPMLTTRYRLECSGDGGQASTEIEIAVRQKAPVAIAAFDAVPSTITVGESSRLDWTTENASECRITTAAGDPAMTVPNTELAKGSRLLKPERDTTYTLTCSGDDGPVVRTATVQVKAARPASVFWGGFED